MLYVVNDFKKKHQKEYKQLNTDSFCSQQYSNIKILLTYQEKVK